MARKKVLVRKKDNKVIDLGRSESPKDPVDPEVTREFQEAQKLGGSGTLLLERRLREHNSRTPDLSANDLDARWEGADVGDETVGGDNMTPDQSVVEEIGEAVGIDRSDLDPLRASVEERPDRSSGILSRTKVHQRRDQDDLHPGERTEEERADWE